MFALRRTLTTSAVLAAGRRGKHTLPDLTYDYGALEPVISGHIMELHHKKHHQTYVNNLNAAEEKLHEALQKNDVAAQVAIQPAIRFNGGGHINHAIFWTNLAPAKNGGGQAPTSGTRVISLSPRLLFSVRMKALILLSRTGALYDAIVKDFGSVDALIEKMSAASVAVQGSGWGWLVRARSPPRSSPAPSRSRGAHCVPTGL